MPIWIQTMIYVALGAQLTFDGYIVLRAMQISRDVGELTARVASQERRCSERLTWIRQLDDKLDQTLNLVTKIHGFMEGRGGGPR